MPSQTHDNYEEFCERLYQYGKKEGKKSQNCICRFTSLSVGKTWSVLTPQL